MRIISIILALVLLPVSLYAAEKQGSLNTVLAQQPVYNRTQPGFEIPGTRLGALMLHPSVEIMEIFDNNIYATQRNAKSDFITVATPSITATTLNPNHGAEFKASGNLGFYNRFSKENYSDYTLQAKPYLRMSRASVLRGNLMFQRSHELRLAEAAINNIGAEEPVRYNQSTGRLFWEYTPNRFGVTPHIEQKRYHFENVARMGGGASFINDDRDRSENEAGIELHYDIGGQSRVYWQNVAFNRNYKRNDYDTGTLSYSGPTRDSDGLKSCVGVKMPLTDLVKLDVNAGLHRQNFDAAAFKDIDTAIGQLDMTWLVTPLTTIDLGAKRQVFETNQVVASGFIQNGIEAKVTHELRRNILLGVNGGIGVNDYVGDTRKDDYWGAGMSATYRMNRNMNWKAGYLYDRRVSNLNDADFSKHQVLLSLQVKF